MKGPRIRFLVHVAGVPGADHVQRCVPCGAVLTDGRPWAEGRAVVLDGDDRDGPSWWPPGAMVATNKRRDGTVGGMAYVVDGRGLDDKEGPCITAR